MAKSGGAQKRAKEMELNGRWPAMVKMLLVAIPILCSANIGFAAWTANRIVGQGADIATINASRFTAEDGLEVWKEIANLRTLMAGLPTEVPPRWFLDRVARLEADMTVHNEKIERRLEILERDSP